MNPNSEKVEKRRLFTSYFTSMISIALVLFMAGLIGILILNSQKLSVYMKENIGYSVVLKDSISQDEILKLKASLSSSPQLRSVRYITPDMAADEMQTELGEDFIQFVGYNPLPAVIEIRFKAEYATPENMSQFEQKIKQNPIVQQVRYEKSVVQMVNENVKKISLVILAFGVLFFLVSWVLLNNTIRLLVYSRRFIIHTMQLVGAKRSFIRKPFLWRSILQGFLGAVLANLFILAVFYFGKEEIPELSLLIDNQIFMIIFAGITLLGIAIHLISTFFAVTAYLRMKEDDLYLI
jgi:cell division transport system permease protein